MIKFESKMVSYEKESLMQYLSQEKKDKNIVAERDFVEEVRSYTKTQSEKVLLVTGLRSTGKTIGVMQGINPQETLYLCPAYKNSITDTEVMEYIKQKDFHVLVLDEYGWVEQTKKEEGILANFLAGLTKIGKRVIITGTESAIVHSLQYTDCIHREFEIHTTFVSYKEFCRLYSLQETPETFSKYLENGGIFGSHVLETYGSTQNYIQNAIINNLTAYYPQYDKEMVKAIVYTIFYESITKSRLFEKDLVTAPVFSYKKSLSYEDFLERFGVRTDIVLDYQVYTEITKQLESLKIVVKLQNLRNQKEFQVYITNQAITTQLVKCIYNEDILTTSHVGCIFESAAVCNIYFAKTDNTTMRYLYAKKQGMEVELDFILTEGKEAYLFECKHSKNDDFVISNRASLVKDIVPNLLGDTDVCGRYVLYQGKEKAQTINDLNIVYTNDFSIISRYRDFDAIFSALQKNIDGGNDGDNPAEINR